MSKPATADLVLGVATIALALVLVLVIIPWAITPVPGPMALSPRFWPRLLSWFLVLPGVLIIAGALMQAKGGSAPATAAQQGEPARAQRAGRIALAIGVMIGFAILLPILGIYAASVLLIVVFAPLLGSRHWLLIGAVAVIVPMALSLFFSRVAGTALPRGLFDFLPF